MEKHDRDTNEFEELKELCRPSGQEQTEKAHTEADRPEELVKENEQTSAKEQTGSAAASEETAPKFQLNFDEDAFDSTPVLEEQEKAVHNGGEQQPKRKKKKKKTRRLP